MLFIKIILKSSNLFIFLDIKQPFISVMFVRKFLKANQVWKCIFGHIQVKNLMGILYIFLCNYSEVKYGHLYFVVLGEIVLFFPPVRLLLIRIDVMNRQYSDLLFHIM